MVSDLALGDRFWFPTPPVALVLSATAALVGQQQPPPAAPTPVFRSSVNLVLVDVVVRDRSGAVVKGLKLEDFELLEDGVRQQILTFASEEVTATAAPLTSAATPLSTAAASATAARSPTAAAPAAPAKTGGDNPTPLTSEDVAGHRLLTIVFDTSSIQPEDVQKTADSALKWVDEQMTSADLVAVASIRSSLQILSEFHQRQGTGA